MHARTLGAACAALSAMALVTGCKTIPRAPDFDPDAHVGTSGSHHVRDLVRKVVAEDGFRPAIDFPLKSADDNAPDCTLQISAATNSVNVEKKRNNRAPHGFILALITNRVATCHPKSFELTPGDTIAWFVRYDNAETSGGSDQPQTATGRSGLVLIHADSTRPDEWFYSKKVDRLGYCNHSRRDPTDQALVLTPDSVCNFVRGQGHDASKISALLKKGMDKGHAGEPWRRYVPSGDNLALWFACGGDCCYANFAQR